ncbi:MAG: hypothetical protein BRD30_06805 [Bacteroidetes bacterium QH_2_63_10]|nr:MAG: hypothetical protein BRD30_06805 [Bacteroidetes bacterium QH_2_63_10]
MRKQERDGYAIQNTQYAFEEMEPSGSQQPLAMSDTKAKIIAALDALPEERQREVLDFVEFLQDQTPVLEEEPSEDGTEELNPEDDPILDAIGSVSHGSLAQNIDEDLYGS